MKIRIFTLYPEKFPGPLAIGIYKRALSSGLWSYEVVNIRDFANDKHKTVDDTPYGGGSGMVMRPDVLSKALDGKIDYEKNEKIIYLSPRGRKFDQDKAKILSKEKILNFICGNFEGVDQRVLDSRKIQEISVGDFILSGGETAVLTITDAILRLIPGIIGNEDSKKDESFENGLLEYPQYTKPQNWEKKSPPDVLLSGDHAKIKDWRLSKSEDITRRQRPDLWKKYLDKKNEKH